MSDPTPELLQAMAAYGLHPPSIDWTGKIKRFDGPDGRRGNRSAWYIAYPDAPENAAFGCWRTGVRGSWTNSNGERPDDFDAAAQREEWKRLRQEREAEQLRQYARAAARYARVWDNAQPADPEHPYLRRKGITDAIGLRMVGDRLLVPMKGLEAGSPLMSLQAISPDGFKRFTRGGRAMSTRTTIGPGADSSTIYITEGWATGWSVHQVTGHPVLVAFSAGNLKAVAQYARHKFPDARLVIAADNDRWSSLRRRVNDELVEIPNPGVHYAQEAAAESRAQVAIPDFSDLSTKPTDFNDLHQLDGEDAVRRLLLPEEPPEPPGPQEPGEDVDDHEPPPARTTSWIDTAPFRCLGHDRGTYYYLPRGTGQITGLSAGQHKKEMLTAIAPLSWWNHEFPANNGISWSAAQDALFRLAERVGVFRPDRIRGRGCWPEDLEDGEKGYLLHLGDQLLPPGAREFVPPERYDGTGGYIYESQPRLAGPSKKRALDLEGARGVLDLFRDLLWHEEASGYLLAGWVVLAPICGALRWRPHVWVTGDSGAGKTTVMENIVDPLLGGMVKHFEGATSEAGIRQRLGSDGLPVIFDEAEKQDVRSDDRVQSILALARASSSSGNAEVVKGTTHGRAMGFQIRSMFCLSSIGGSLRQEADKTRVSLLQLHGAGSITKEKRAEHWKRFRPKLAAVNTELGRQLLSRTLGWLRDGRLEETIRVFCAEAAVLLGDQRRGDQYGTLYAGAWTLMADEPPDAQEAREILGSEDLYEYMTEQVPAGMRALQILLQRQERVELKKGGVTTVTVGQMIHECRKDAIQLERERDTSESGPIPQDDAKVRMKMCGLSIENDEGETVLLVATNSEWIKRALANTPYSDNMHQALRTLEGVRAMRAPVRFAPGLFSRATRIPLKYVDEA